MTDLKPLSHHVFTVTQLARTLQGVVEETFAHIWVAGEICDLRQSAAGHFYFILKDDFSQLRAVLWRSTAINQRCVLHDGMHVVIKGNLEIYPPRSHYQLVAEKIVPQGVGGIEQNFRQLYYKLEQQGLFSAERKRPLPRFPFKLALITSLYGAALQDIIHVLKRRWPVAHVLVIPVQVQGEDAPDQLTRALACLNFLPEIEVAILARGGGSSEDLWAFNTERVVLAVAACSCPVVSAVGHEIDVTLTDLAADRRALTPTEAAEIITPDYQQFIESLSDTAVRLQRGLLRTVEHMQWRLNFITNSRSWRKPQELWQSRFLRLEEQTHSLHHAMHGRLSGERKRIADYSARLEALSPMHVLRRGYSFTTRLPEGEVVRSVHQTQPGHTLLTHLMDGKVLSRVECITASLEDLAD
ncbi:MAG: exodeoxyribonuclease 7 large subunit [Planctomycetaceae bacterium]|nr:MAG: exodeoxyribonuclease 7 large subunit [Planctomycetaceae bacterium]